MVSPGTERLLLFSTVRPLRDRVLPIILYIMPTYLYKREDGSTFEIEHRITAPVLKTCQTTGQTVKRLISKGAGLIFKGSGFYLTDYVRTSDGTPPGSGDALSPNGKSAERGDTKLDTTGKTEPSTDTGNGSNKPSDTSTDTSSSASGNSAHAADKSSSEQ